MILAPVYCVCSWLDVGVPILLPLQSQDSYWATYWQKKHDEMDEYGKRPICKARWKQGEAHQMGAKPPAEADCTFRKFAIPLGGY